LLALSALVAMLHKKEPAGSKVWHALLLAATIAFMATMLVAPTKISIQEILQFSDIVVAFAAWSFMAFVLLLFIVGAFIRQWMKEEKLAIAYASILGLVAITVAVPIFADYSLPSPSELRHVPDVLRRVWLPAELIGLSNGSERVGYVLKTDGNWTTILWDSDRSVEITRTSNIANRVICRIGRPDGLPLILVPLAEMPKIRSCEIPLIEHPLMPPPRVRLP
jgi:hypothetical protein